LYGKRSFGRNGSPYTGNNTNLVTTPSLVAVAKPLSSIVRALGGDRVQTKLGLSTGVPLVSKYLAVNLNFYPALMEIIWGEVI